MKETSAFEAKIQSTSLFFGEPVLMVTGFLMLNHSVLIYKRELELTPWEGCEGLGNSQGPVSEPRNTFHIQC